MFVKNKYETCRVEVTDSESATLVIGLPPNFGSKIVTNEKVATDQPESQKGITGGDNLDELRVRRQAVELQRDCGVQDMVCCKCNLYNKLRIHHSYLSMALFYREFMCSIYDGNYCDL